MGADIRAWVERRDREGKWHALAEVYFGRDAELFGYMAGVRGLALFEPRGLPKDAQLPVEPPTDCTAPSWLRCREFRRCLRQLGRKATPGARAALAVMERFRKARLVFWFSE